jgi:LacI family transcriptional regulator
MKDVAKDAGVSVGTVSNVLNRPHLVAPATRERVRAAIERLGYVRSETARQLRAGRSRMVALLVLDLTNPFFVQIVRGAAEVVREAGYGAMVCHSAHDPAEEAEYVSLFAEHRVRGVLVTPTDAHGENLAPLRAQGIPYVCVDRAVAPEDACSVSVDDLAGARAAVAHLLAGGHRRIAYVNGPTHLVQCRDRLAGARAAVREVPGADLHVLDGDGLDVAAGRDAGARLLGLQPRPTAVFCANDLIALGVLQTMHAAGVPVPQRMAIVGYDDIEFAAAAAVPLTSVRQPAARMGRRAARLLLAEADGAPDHRHEQIVFRPELYVRGSTSAAGY